MEKSWQMIAPVPRRRVLLIEEICSPVSLSERLSSAGYALQVAVTRESGYETALRVPFEMILLDMDDGVELGRELLSEGLRVPIVLLSTRSGLEEKVRALHLCADDYLVKPVEPAELIARMEAIFRRTYGARNGADQRGYRFGDIHVDFTKQQVRSEQTVIDLLPLEYRLLRHFIFHRNRVLSRRRLMDEVWGYGSISISRTVDVHVSGLRRKIEPEPRHPRYLLTVPHRGYKFVG